MVDPRRLKDWPRSSSLTPQGGVDADPVAALPSDPGLAQANPATRWLPPALARARPSDPDHARPSGPEDAFPSDAEEGPGASETPTATPTAAITQAPEDQAPVDSGAMRWLPKDWQPGPAKATVPGRLAAESLAADDAGPARSQSSELVRSAAAPDPVAAELDPARAEAAVRAYCGELCDPAGADQAVTESLAAFENAAGSSIAGAAELLRTTRTTAAWHASAGDSTPGWRGLVATGCGATPAGLAARANDELTPNERRELEDHLDRCLHCRITELKVDRAERAFASLAGAVAIEPRPKMDEPPLETAERGSETAESESDLATSASLAYPAGEAAEPTKPRATPRRRPARKAKKRRRSGR